MRRPFRARRPLLFLALAGAMFPYGCDSSSSERTAPAALTPLEASHLVRRHIAYLTTESVESDGARIRVTAVAGNARIEADVDPGAARVTEIRSNGGVAYRWPGVRVVAHRGAGFLAPENTLAALRRAMELGAHCVEIDVRQTADGVFVLMHDATVNRTTDGTGEVAAMTLERIKQLDAGSKFSAEFALERVPTLEEALAIIHGRVTPDIDFKAGDAAALVAVLRARGLEGRILFHAQDPELLRAAAATGANFNYRPTLELRAGGLPFALREWNPPAFTVHYGMLTPSLAREIHLAGREVYVHLIGPEDAEFGLRQAVAAGADYIHTDRPELLLRLLKE